MRPGLNHTEQKADLSKVCGFWIRAIQRRQTWQGEERGWISVLWGLSFRFPAVDAVNCGADDVEQRRPVQIRAPMLSRGVPFGRYGPVAASAHAGFKVVLTKKRLPLPARELRALI